VADYTVGDLVAEVLQRFGVGTVFGIVSVHNIPMLDAIGRGNALRMVSARGEAGAGHMADAYARVSGGLGVVITSTGPGAANAVPALVEARFASTPLLHLTGQTATRHIDRDQGTVHDTPGQTAMLAAIGKAALRVRAPEETLGVLVKAATLALTAPCGPVSVEIPVDLQRAPVARPETLDTLVLPVPPVVVSDDASLEALAAMLRAARRPLLWVGNGGKHAGAAIGRLTALGVPVITSWNGRGAVPEDHPLCLGSTAGLPAVKEFMTTVDLLLIAGSRLRGQETADLSLPLPQRRAQIDVDPAANGRTYPVDLFVQGEVAATLDALADRLAAGGYAVDPGLAAEVARTRDSARAAYDGFLGAYAALPAAVRAALPRDGLFVRDVTLSHTTWGHNRFELYGPRDTVYPVGAAIGPGMAMAIGAAIGAGEGGDRRKTLCLSGDGGFAVNLGEMWTAADERADVVFLVMNDRGFGVIKHIQDALYDGRKRFADPTPPDFEALAGSTGMPYARVTALDALPEALFAALAHDGPALVEVDMTAIGPYPRYYVPPPYARR